MHKQSSIPYHWLTPGYYKDKVKTNVFLLHFTATYVTFYRHICEHPLGVLAPQVKNPDLSSDVSESFLSSQSRKSKLSHLISLPLV